ncbi:MAG: nickel pincer cofactor biosynthesis protein LarB [Candidatus Thermoplasmatota archaeon]|nr:nickel pincer cofactor biosynthesis protein LarB [Candidatus Thermoplasmatota archaeon]
MHSIRDVLESYRAGKISAGEAEAQIRSSELLELDGFCIDLNRERRTGIPEFILAEGKTLDQIERGVDAVKKRKGWAVITRVSEDAVKILKKHDGMKCFPEARLCVVGEVPKAKLDATVGVITAGTSDIQVAEEARIVCELMGCKTMKSYDVGVAGIHRLFKPLGDMAGKVDVYIVAAGREGALAGVVAGLVGAPVIGLPVSTGYGFRGKGEAALSSMLQSCTPLLAVNIDAGFVAGVAASQICQKISGRKNKD